MKPFCEITKFEFTSYLLKNINVIHLFSLKLFLYEKT